MRTRRFTDRGHSLIEMVIVLGVAATLLAMGFAGVSLVASRRLAAVARTLASDVRMVEQRARSERTCYRIQFDPGAETYRIVRYAGPVVPGTGASGPACAAAGAWTPLPAFREVPGDVVSRRLPPGVDLVSTTFPLIGNLQVLTVSALGNTQAGTVVLRGPGGVERRVVVEVLGRVRIVP